MLLKLKYWNLFFISYLILFYFILFFWLLLFLLLLKVARIDKRLAAYVNTNSLPMFLSMAASKSPPLSLFLLCELADAAQLCSPAVTILLSSYLPLHPTWLIYLHI